MSSVSFASSLLVAATLLAAASAPVRADGETEMRHGGWRACLSRNFQVQVALTDPDLAADAAFRACRDAEDAYLAALARSPLLDDDDVARARPMLTGRIRAWLVEGRG